MIENWRGKRPTRAEVNAHDGPWLLKGWSRGIPERLLLFIHEGSVRRRGWADDPLPKRVLWCPVDNDLQEVPWPLSDKEEP